MNIEKSHKLDNVCYDIRGTVHQEARRLEDEGHRIIKLNIGNRMKDTAIPRDYSVHVRLLCRITSRRDCATLTLMMCLSVTVVLS